MISSSCSTGAGFEKKDVCGAWSCLLSLLLENKRPVEPPSSKSVDDALCILVGCVATAGTSWSISSKRELPGEASPAPPPTPVPSGFPNNAASAPRIACSLAKKSAVGSSSSMSTVIWKTSPNPIFPNNFQRTRKE